jgi:hypothetical protein
MDSSAGLGCLLGAAIAAYMYLHPAAIGFSFPNIDRQLAVRPTMPRIALFLLGRYLGYFIIGLIGGWLGFWLGNYVIQRLCWCISIFFALFMLLFVLTANSPELEHNRFIHPPHNWPIFLIGAISSIILIAPYFIAFLQLFHLDSSKEGMIFFTFVFLGNAIFSLPMLLNMKWHQEYFYKNLLRWILIITAGIVLFSNIRGLLYS